MKRALAPWIVAGIFVVYLLASAVQLRGRASSGFDVAAFGRLPAWVNGRVQPLESVARSSLLQIRGSLSGLDPALWLLEVLAKPDDADRRRIFPITHRELVETLQLDPRGRGIDGYAFRDLGPKASAIRQQLQGIESLKASDRAPWQVELVALRDKLVLYERLKNSLQPNTRLQQDAHGGAVAFDFAGELARYQADLAEALRVDAGRRRGSPERLDVAAELRLRTFAGLFQVVSRTGFLATVPPAATKGGRGAWSNIGTVLVQSAQGHPPPEPVTFLAGMSSAFAQGSADAFNSRVADHRRWLAAHGFAPEARRAGFEALSNLLLPLVRAVALHAVALVLLIVARRTRSATVQRSGLMLAVLAAIMNATGLVFATILAGRPSWIAISGCALAAAALVVEGARRSGSWALASAAIGLAALVTVYGMTPGGAASLSRNVVDAALLVAIAASAVVLCAGRERRSAERRPTVPLATLESPIA